MYVSMLVWLVVYKHLNKQIQSVYILSIFFYLKHLILHPKYTLINSPSINLNQHRPSIKVKWQPLVSAKIPVTYILMYIINNIV